VWWCFYDDDDDDDDDDAKLDIELDGYGVEMNSNPEMGHY